VGFDLTLLVRSCLPELLFAWGVRMTLKVGLAAVFLALLLTSCASQSSPIPSQNPEQAACDSFTDIMHIRNDGTEELTGTAWASLGPAVRNNSGADFAFAIGLNGLEGGGKALGGRSGRMSRLASANAQNLKDLADLIELYPAPSMLKWAAQMKSSNQMARARDLLGGMDSANWELVSSILDASEYCATVIADAADLDLN